MVHVEKFDEGVVKLAMDSGAELLLNSRPSKSMMSLQGLR